MHLQTPSGSVERMLEKRTTPPGSLWPASPWDIAPPTNGMLGTGVGGLSSERQARGLSAFYSCLSVLYDGLATLPLRQFKGAGTDRVEIDLSPVIYDPWPEITDLDFRGSGTWGLAARGNFIGRVTDRDKRRYPLQIQPLDNDAVSLERNKTTGMVEYRINGQTVPIPADDVVHIRNIVRPGSVLGLNPIAELRLTWALASGADAYAATFFSNAAVPNGVITIDGDYTEDAARDLRDQWLQAHQGTGNANLPAVLTGGAKWTQLAINLEDAQFIESRGLSRSEIAGVFRIPPHMIGDVDRSTSWGTGVEQQETGFVRNVLGGYIRKWEVGLSRCLPANQYVEFDLRRRLRGDSVQRAAIIISLVNAGVINRNEARVLYEDLPPVDGLDTYLQPLNMGEAGAFQPPLLPKGSNQAPPAPEVRSFQTLSSVVDDMHRLLALRDLGSPPALPAAV